MRRLAIIFAVLTVVLYLTESAAFGQHRYGRGGRVRDMPGMRGRGGPSHEKKLNHGTERSRTRGSKSAIELNGRKSVSDRLSRNSKLSARLRDVLQVEDLAGASSGFKNLGQFVAAVHVSNNLGIGFDDLKMYMTDPDSPKSLRRAIREFRPDVSARREARKANQQASKDLKETSQ